MANAQLRNYRGYGEMPDTVGAEETMARAGAGAGSDPYQLLRWCVREARDGSA